MLSEDVVFLDSDDDKELKPKMEESKDPVAGESSSQDTENNTKAGEEEEVVVEYNHNDYADLVGPLKPVLPTPVLRPPPPNKTLPIRPRVTEVTDIKRIPKKPGSVPPFALFSQEMRPKLQEEDPEMSFGDLGRKMGELWHALKEEEKEVYRKRARQIADARMKSWNETMKSLPEHKRRMVESQQRTNHIKRKRTSGYAVFCSEYRRKCHAEDPQAQFSEVSRKVADEWRMISNEKKRSYEARAQRYNQEEDRKWRMRMAAQQRTRGVPLQPGQTRPRGPVPVRRGGGYSMVRPSQPGLVISSVSSLSTENNTFNLPKVEYQPPTVLAST